MVSALQTGVVASVLASSAAVLPLLGAEREFEQFILDHGRDYSESEKARRFTIFADNLSFIRKENSKNHAYTLAVNQFADLTTEEAKSYLGLRAPEAGHWKGRTHLGQHEAVDGLKVPSSVDWVSAGAVTPVKNQGQCGSCWSFSTTGAMEGAWQIATGQLVSLSEQQLVDCDLQQGGCGGGWPYEAIEWEEGQNVCTEESYGYTAQRGSCRASSCSTGIPRGGIVGYKDVAKGDANAMVQALAQQPVSVCVDAEGVFMSYGGGVLHASCGTSLDHAILAVGYGRDSTSGLDYWKVKNSWGTGWGEGGYIRMVRGQNRDECGVLDAATYAVVQGSPSPSPSPSPVPSPTPSPSPSGDYEQPPCASSEVEFALYQGVDLCSPKCNSDYSCPSAPSGSATPQCMWNYGGSYYCALTCQGGGECPQGSYCFSYGNGGVCAYYVSSSPEMVAVPAPVAELGAVTV